MFASIRTLPVLVFASLALSSFLLDHPQNYFPFLLAGFPLSTNHPSSALETLLGWNVICTILGPPCVCLGQASLTTISPQFLTLGKSTSFCLPCISTLTFSPVCVTTFPLTQHCSSSCTSTSTPASSFVCTTAFFSMINACSVFWFLTSGLTPFSVGPSS